MIKRTAPLPICPCGIKQPYANCCAPYHHGTPAPTAEALMRSRYTAYVYRLEDHLLATWHPDTRPVQLELAHEPAPKWLGLEVRQSADLSETTAIVEFIARYKVGGKAERLHETSRFERIDGCWYYLDGTLHS
ncbi:MAG TPA: YchJ family metal-binding protein [Methylophilaceae bacterium]|nr:YchJ family metal-binding protein [Methylophilaceae bacterium]